MVICVVLVLLLEIAFGRVEDAIRRSADTGLLVDRSSWVLWFMSGCVQYIAGLQGWRMARLTVRHDGALFGSGGRLELVGNVTVDSWL